MPIPLNISSIGKQATALANNARAQTASSINAVKNSIGLRGNDVPSYLSSVSTDSLVFPIELRGQPSVNTIEFTAYVKGTDGVKQHKIFFPCPANIAINDSATYNAVELGVMGGVAVAATESGGEGSGVSGMAGKVMAQIGTTTQNFKAGEIGAAIGAKLPGVPASVKGIASIKGRTLDNPNTNTVFNGNALRTFAFSFKMIASSEDEAELVRKIHSKFRAFTYADAGGAQNILLAFPPTWTIRFLNGEGKENPYIPKVYSCYLLSIESSFNATTNMFHSGGAPLEVDINISYQESRVLNRFDINNLEAGSLGDDRGIDENGAPRSSGSTDTNTTPKQISGPND
tara:strand:+ start:2139 stop:3170 length:1032 start_codon:yes stop_codon:yes gene_type:complete